MVWRRQAGKTVGHDTRSELFGTAAWLLAKHITPQRPAAKHKHSRDGGPAGGLPGLGMPTPFLRRADRGRGQMYGGFWACVGMFMCPSFPPSCLWLILAHPAGPQDQHQPCMGKGSEFRLGPLSRRVKSDPAGG